jgi:acyl carrier protein phosphodiesterase
MFYDHVLAKNWSKYSPIQLESFTNSVYKVLGTQVSVFPHSAQLMYAHMSKHDWLTNYANLNGMQKALNGLSRRATFVSKMEEAVVDLERDFKFYEEEFDLFFPQIIEYANSWTKAYE